MMILKKRFFRLAMYTAKKQFVGFYPYFGAEIGTVGDQLLPSIP